MPHQRLLLKLKAHCLGNDVINWIEKWLTHRRQRVILGGDISEQCGIAASKGNQILGLIKEKQLIVPLYKAIVRPHLEYSIQAWRQYHKKDIDKLERLQRRATKIIPELRDLSYERGLLECGLTTLSTCLKLELVVWDGNLVKSC